MNNKKYITLGFDLDNTIAIYDQVICKLVKNIQGDGVEKLVSKIELANYLRKRGREAEWIKIQGMIYGPLMKNATISTGFVDALKKLDGEKYRVQIVSHRTQSPASGDDFNLHHSAISWVKENLIDNELLRHISIKLDLATSLEDKLSKIAFHKPIFFIDDLPKVLNDENFPAVVQKFLYAPNNKEYDVDGTFEIIGDWEKFFLSKKLIRI